MLKKEFQDTLRILLESSLFMLSIPVVLLVAWIFGLQAPSADLIFAVSFVTVFVYAAYSGMALFLREKRDNSFEYLLTLPISRFKILLLKMIPRLLILAVLVVVLGLFYRVTFNGVVVPLLYFHLGMVFLSLAFTRSYFAGFVAAILLGFVYTFGGRCIYAGLFLLGGKSYTLLEHINPTLTAAALLLIPLAISFFLVLKKLDLKPYKYLIRPYLFIAAPVIAVELILMFSLYESFRYWF